MFPNNDNLKAQLDVLGYTSPSVNDATVSYLSDLNPTVPDTFPDLLDYHLGILGYTGSLVDKVAAWDGIINTPPYTLTQRGSVLTASDAAIDDNFGTSVAVSADGAVMVVGARFWETGAGYNTGAVYTYDRNGTSWTLRGTVLTAGDAANEDSFGAGVALSADGEILIVGTAGRNSSALTDSGGVYVYDRSGTSWVQRGSVLVASDIAAGDQFGVSVSCSSDGEILAVGAHSWEGATGTNRGGVYIFDRNGSGWTQRGAVLAAPDAADNDGFGIGISLSADGETLIVGAFNWEGTTGTNRGGVYTFDRNGTGWIQRGDVLEATDAADTDNFGIAVNLSADGSTLAVGATGWEGSSGTDRGGMYLYTHYGDRWLPNGDVLTATDGADSDNFARGIAMTLTGNTLAIAARDWEGSLSNQGGVYIFDIT